MTTVPRILIFDSGVGGLSITESIQAQHPYCSITYASDNAAFPYGTKQENELIDRVDKVLHQLQQQCQADIIVVACNTASTVALPKIRQRFKLPIVGVVPAIKPAASLSQTKVLGLLATPGTIARSYTQDLIDEFARDCSVITLGSSELVHLAEEKLRSPHSLSSSFHRRLADIVSPLADSAQMDTLVLACTHFPLLQEELKHKLPNIKHWVDSGEAIARRVGYWLDELKLRPGATNSDDLNPSLLDKSHYSLFTINSQAQRQTIEQLAPALSQRGLGDMRFIEV